MDPKVGGPLLQGAPHQSQLQLGWQWAAGIAARVFSGKPWLVEDPELRKAPGGDPLLLPGEESLALRLRGVDSKAFQCSDPGVLQGC